MMTVGKLIQHLQLAIIEDKLSPNDEVYGKWYIDRPLPYYGWRNIFTRIYHAWLVLSNKAVALQYTQDRKIL